MRTLPYVILFNSLSIIEKKLLLRLFLLGKIFNGRFAKVKTIILIVNLKN